MSEVLSSRAELTTVTPMMQQYLEVKNQYDDYILMYRLGDFFECFFEDAVTVSRTLELTLTARDCGGGKRAAMCGVPFHKADVYIGRLVEQGFKVAVCEQVENPAEAEGIVRREVVRVVTPGTVTDDSCLTDRRNNYLAALYLAHYLLEAGHCLAVCHFFHILLLLLYYTCECTAGNGCLNLIARFQVACIALGLAVKSGDAVSQ